MVKIDVQNRHTKPRDQTALHGVIVNTPLTKPPGSAMAAKKLKSLKLTSPAKIGLGSKTIREGAPYANRIARLMRRIDVLSTAPKRNFQELNQLKIELASMQRAARGPTRNFSAGAAKSAIEFRNLKTAQIGRQTKRERADAIKQAVLQYYGIK